MNYPDKSERLAMIDYCYMLFFTYVPSWSLQIKLVECLLFADFSYFISALSHTQL